MNQDFFLGQLRLIMVGVIAWLAGNGKLSTADGTFIGAVGAPSLLLFGPWLWSIYRNIGMKLVPKDSVAISGDTPHAVITNDDGSKTITALASTAKIVGCLLFAMSPFLVLLGLFLISPASAQDRPRLILQPPIVSKDAGGDIMRALDAKLLPDLQYALKMAQATKSDLTANCYQAWIDLIEARASANAGDPPNPAVISNFERAVEIRNALQPDSKFMIACSPVANMVKSDILSFVGKIVGGGISAGMLIPGL